MSGSLDPMRNGPVGAPLPGPNNPTAQEIMDHMTGKDPAVDETGVPVSQEKRVPRDAPQPAEPRRRLVAKITASVKADKKHHDAAFKRMRDNMRFANGEQWDQDKLADTARGHADPRYVANIALRHVQQRTASLYATNPKVIATQRQRMLATIWDGDAVTLQAAQSQMQQAVQMQAQMAAQSGVPVVPGQMPPGLSPNVLAILADVKNVQTYEKMLKRVCKTLEIVWDYNVKEQTFPFKSMMKMTVRRAIVTSVGYIKLGFQRAMHLTPEIETRIADMTERLATIERLADNIADGEIQRDAAEAEQLRLSIQALTKEPQVIAREGLLFDYPESTAIIPDLKCKSLRGFLGADHVTQEYSLTPDEIQEIYGVDVGASFRGYTVDGEPAETGAASREDGDAGRVPQRGMVWETYSRKDGLVYITCDGYPDFLREPAAPDVYLDRFWPWFPMVLNEGYHDKEIYPKSDIDLIRDMQLELNRARQGLREHRRANRPKTVAAAGILEDDDKAKLANHPANALIELNGLPPGTKVEDVLQPMKMPAIDPALYDTNATFEDILRVLGTDQAGQGQTTSATATEASIAQSSQHTDLASCLDDQDDLLSELAQAGGKILMLNVSARTVQKIVGPGAVWPELTKEDVAENIYLTVQAGSTGRPNKQQEVQNAQILFPMLQRVPGISPEWMARELIKRMDDRLDLTEAFIAGMPSMDALNRIQGTAAVPSPVDPANPVPVQPGAAAPGAPVPSPSASAARPGATSAPAAPVAPPMGGAPNDPTAQGSQGAQNAQVPPPTNGLLGPRTPPVPGANGLMPGQGGGPAGVLRHGNGTPTP